MCSDGVVGRVSPATRAKNGEGSTMWYVTCHVQKDGRVNLGTAKHAESNCSTLKGRLVHHIEGAVVAEIPSCAKCAAMWKSSDPYHLKHGGDLKPLNMTCDTVIHLLIEGHTPCDMSGLPCDWPSGHKWMNVIQWETQAPLGEEPFQYCAECSAWSKKRA